MRSSCKIARALSALPCAILLVAAEARAAQTTWADPLGLCAGELPCFQTISEALASAGPAPASVFVFPGTYAESVDLATMGSALPGGTAGELALVSVDATGQPLPGAVVDPGAPGGPGAGSAIHAFAFPAPLEIYGFAVRSPDTDALFLNSGASNVTLSRIEAIGSPQGGGILVFQKAGDVAVTRSAAALNGGSGIAAVSLAGTVTLLDCLADRNDSSGILGGGTDVTVAAAVATANDENGFLFLPTATNSALRFSGILAANNDTGVLTVLLDTGELFATMEIDDLSVSANLDDGAVLFGGAVVARDLEAFANGAEGLSFAASTIDLDDAVAEDNGARGIVALGVDVEVRNSRAAGNRSGFLLSAEQLLLEASSATAHITASPDLFDGVGFLLAEVESAVVSDTLTLDNRTGWLVADVDALPLSARSRIEAIARGPGRRSTISEGGAPVRRITIERSRTEGSLEAAMRVFRGPGGELRVSCSDFVTNGPSGLTLYSESIVDARANYWGDSDGPNHPANPGGLGDAVRDGANGFAGQVLYAPFLAAHASAEDCPAGPIVEIPALGPTGLVLLALAMAFAALASRRFRETRVAAGEREARRTSLPRLLPCRPSGQIPVGRADPSSIPLAARRAALDATPPSSSAAASSDNAAASARLFAASPAARSSSA